MSVGYFNTACIYYVNEAGSNPVNGYGDSPLPRFTGGEKNFEVHRNH